MNFKIPEPVIPSEEKMREVALSWWGWHDKINFLDWNETLIRHTIPFESFKLSSESSKLILRLLDDRKVTIYDVIDSLPEELKNYDWGTGRFIKLITRSPKDLFEDNTDMKCNSLKECIKLLTYSIRCFEDLCLLMYIDKSILIIRPFVHIDKSKEWRCFIKNREVVGITQYHYTELFNYVTPEQIRLDITGFLQDIVIPNVDLENFVADVIMPHDSFKEICLLELNPYGLSDPCLYKDYNSFDNNIKINLQP